MDWGAQVYWKDDPKPHVRVINKKYTETLKASKNCRFTESRSLTRAHKNSRSSVSTRRIGVKFAAIDP